MSAWVDSAGCHIATYHVALGERDLLAPHERQSLESEHLPASQLPRVAYEVDDIVGEDPRILARLDDEGELQCAT